jgi:hypothetical protein
MPSLVEIMTAVSDQLTSSIKASRQAFEHNLTKGEAVEGAVRKFFRDHLPSSIGVAHGQVIDRHGTTSKQLDVILFDARRTPILFSDEANENRIIPVEGVIAVVESKTSLQIADIPTLAESARILKSLDRSAYYVGSNPIVTHVINGYGQEWPTLPPMYFVISFDGPRPETVAQAMIATSLGKPLYQRIDMACIIQRGIVANCSPDGSGIEALPFPGSKTLAFETKNSLLLFYILMSRYVLQSDLPPISIQSYLPADFNF